MDLEVKKERGKFYVVDRDGGQKLNKGKPFSTRAQAVKYMESKMGAEKLSEGGEMLMPKGGMPDMSALMGGGMPPMPGMMGQAPMPGKMDQVRMNPRGAY
jgi:hypothetical protein